MVQKFRYSDPSELVLEENLEHFSIALNGKGMSGTEKESVKGPKDMREEELVQHGR